MNSIIEPLTKKSTIFLTNISSIKQGLNNGDPEAKKQLSSLMSSLGLFKQDCKSTYNQMTSNQKMALDTSSSLTRAGGVPLVEMLQYYAKEVFNALKLVNNLIKISDALVSISSLLVLINNDLTSSQQNLNTKFLWLTRSLTRTKQKLAKDIEWNKRTSTAKLNIEYLKGQIKQYQASLLKLQQSLPAKPEPMPGINGQYDSINTKLFIYWDTSLNSSTVTTNMSGTSNTLISSSSESSKIASANVDANTGNVGETNNQILATQNKINSLNIELQESQKELDVYIKADKTFWAALWKTQEKQDKDRLLNNSPHGGN